MSKLAQIGMNNATELLILLFIVITFLQSSLDKILDWKGNLTYIKSVFKKTFLNKFSPFLLIVITIGEIVAGTLSLAGIIQIYINGNKTLGLFGVVIASKILLALLLGQRIAKDYAGAMTIAVYFGVTVFGVYVLSNS